MRIALAITALILLASLPNAQTVDPGRATFVNRCAGCHGTDGNGGELGPAIATRVPPLSDQDLTTLLREGRPALGMPPFASLTSTESSELIRYLRTIKPRGGFTPTRATLRLEDGRSLEGVVFNQSLSDAQVLGSDGKIHLLRGNILVLSPRDVAVRLAELQRRDERQPLQPAHADHARATSRSWRRSGSSACPTRRACR